MYSKSIAKHSTALSGALPFLYAKTVALHGAKLLLWQGRRKNVKRIHMMILKKGRSHGEWLVGIAKNRPGLEGNQYKFQVVSEKLSIRIIRRDSLARDRETGLR